MWRRQGPEPEQGYRYIHAVGEPFPEFPALTHVNEAICAPDHVLSPHQHEVMEVCYFVVGRAEWTSGGASVQLGPGDFFISEPGEIHGGRPDPAEPNHNFAIGFDPRQLPLGSARGSLLPAPSRDLVDAIGESTALQ
ncbi:MAG: AraC family ligand binding domain-containing protein, partial [Planctomycetes bacterium]|nr:AraC family ligand binding domain-containing protein [Planctomycetota bacterium]